jgi:hypothetical protein
MEQNLDAVGRAGYRMSRDLRHGTEPGGADSSII